MTQSVDDVDSEHNDKRGLVYYKLYNSNIDFEIPALFQLGKRLFDSKGGQSGRGIVMPALGHEFGEHPLVLVSVPAIGDGGPNFLRITDFFHVVETGIRGDDVVKRKLIFVDDSAADAPPGDFPEHQPETVHVGHLVRVEAASIQRLGQDFRRHVSLRALTRVGRNVHFVGVAHVPDGEPEIRDARRPVSFHENVLGFDIPMRDGRFALSPVDFCMQMRETGSCGEREAHRRDRVQNTRFEIVVKAAVFVVFGDEEELRPAAGALDVRRYETENVFVAHEDRLVDFRFAEPRGFFRREEDLDGDRFASPFALPHFAITPFADGSDEMNLLGDRPLD